MKKLMRNLKIISHEINVRFKVIAKAIDARMEKQDKKFANICFAEITTFVKNNILLIKQILFLLDFVEHLYKILYEVHEIYHKIVNVQMNTQFN